MVDLEGRVLPRVNLGTCFTATVVLADDGQPLFGRFDQELVFRHVVCGGGDILFTNGKKPSSGQAAAPGRTQAFPRRVAAFRCHSQSLQPQLINAVLATVMDDGQILSEKKNNGRGFDIHKPPPTQPTTRRLG